MGNLQHDRNLLVGILALQMNFIQRDQLFSALHIWRENKHAALEDILLAQNSLQQEARDFLAAIVAKHIEMHADDPAKGLAAVSSFDALQDELRRFNDAEIDATMARASAAHAEEVTATISFHPQAGALANRFRVIRPHARGGLGQVSVARDQELNREVALKEIQPQFAADEQARQRFLVEAEITGRLEHPSIVPVYSLGQFNDGRPFYVMRFIRGDSLNDAIAEFHKTANGPYGSSHWQRELRKLLRRLIDVCNAIEYAHSRGILHRDLKPGNIMLGKYGETLVVDWGLAKAVQQLEPDRFVSEGPLKPVSGEGSCETVMGSVVGTPSFMSPEQASGQLDLLGPATDVYSLGATLYCILTQQSPFPTGPRDEILAKVRRGEFSRPRSISSQVPRPLEAVCLKAMALNPADRYATPMAFADDLERWLADEPVTVYRDPLIERGLRTIRHHKTAFVGTAVLLATVVVGLIVNNAMITKKNTELRIARDRANDNMELAIEQQGLAVENLATSRKLAVDLLDLAENELSKMKGKELLRQKMTNRSAELFREFHKQKPEDFQLRLELAQVLRMQANITRLMEETAKSLELYAEAVHLLEGLRAEKPSDEKVADRLAETLRDHGSAFKLFGRLAEAEQAYARARTLAAALVIASPTEPNFRRTMATLDTDIADLQTLLGRPEEALRHTHSAVEVFREFTDGGSNYPVDPILLLLASATEGELLLELGRYDEAEVVFNDAIRRARKRLEAGQETNTLYLLGRLLTGYARTRLIRGESTAQALAAMDEAIAVLQKLVTDIPTTKVYRRYLAAALNARGDWRRKQNDVAAAVADFEMARQTMVPVTGTSDADISNLEALADSVANLGQAAMEQNPSEAAAKFAEALELYSRITQRAPDHAIAKRKRQQVDKLLQSLKAGQ